MASHRQTRQTPKRSLRPSDSLRLKNYSPAHSSGETHPRRLVREHTTRPSGPGRWAVGTTAGMALAWSEMRLLAGLAGVAGGADPLVLTGAALALGAVAVAASWLPARTAARIDPVAVLRSE